MQCEEIRAPAHPEILRAESLRLAYHRVRDIHSEMIGTFRDKDTQALFFEEPVLKFQGIERAALRKLLLLHAATRLEDLLSPPGNRLEALKGNRIGQYSIRINSKWRICFRWVQGNAYQVEIVDYH
jgi:proteic killer suppression protein